MFNEIIIIIISERYILTIDIGISVSNIVNHINLYIK